MVIRTVIVMLFALLSAACQTESSPTENSPSDFDATDLWQTIRSDFDLFYAYRDQRGFDANAYLDRVGIAVSHADNLTGFRQILNRATYAFTDPHLGFGPHLDTDFNVIPTAADIQILYENEQYRVIDVRADSAASEAGVRPGWVFTHADKAPVSHLFTSVFANFVDDPNNAQRSYAATLIANGRRTEKRSLTFLDADGITRNLTLPNPRQQARMIMKSDPILVQWVEGPDNMNIMNIAWIRINNRLGENSLITAFDAAMSDIQQADGLILDLRNTPSGGNAEVGRSIMGHFVKEAMPFQIHERPSLEREFTVPRRYVEYVLPRTPSFNPDRTVVLGGYWTGSMGEGIVIGLDAIGLHTISSDMGDLLGGMSQFSYADGAIQLSVPTEALFHVDGTAREDFIAKTALRSADTDESGGDPALKAALQVLSQR